MPIALARPVLKRDLTTESRRRGFDEAKHARGEHGRFTAGVRDSRDPAPSTTNVVALAPRPPHAMKLREDRAFKQQDLVDQRPEGMPAAEHEARKARLKKLIVSLAPATIERGHEQIKRGAMKGATLIPTDTAPETVSRAYTHAAMLALHGFGVARYDYSMPKALQQELTPLVPFMRYAQRRVLNTMLDVEKGQWKPYRAAFGEPFADKRRDKITGQVRLRMSPRQQVIKAAPMGTLAKAFQENEHERAEDGRFSSGQIAAATAGGSAAVALPVGVMLSAEMHRKARAKAIGNIMREGRGKKIVWRGSRAPDPNPKVNAYGGVFVANTRHTAKKLVDHRGGYVNKYEMEPHTRIAPSRSQAAARILFAHGDDMLQDVDKDVFRTNAGMEPKGTNYVHYRPTRMHGKIHAGLGSFWRVNDKQRVAAAKLGVHGVAAPEFRLGDASVLFNAGHLRFLGAERMGGETLKGTIGTRVATAIGRGSLKFVRVLHKGDGTHIEVARALPMGSLVKAFEEGKHKRAHDGEFTGANANVQLAAGAIGGAAAAFTGSRAAKKSVARAGTIVGRRTGAAVRLAARHFDIAKTPEIASVVRDQSRLVGNFAGRQTRKRLGFGVALGAGLLGNYGGELIARRASGATGADDAYQGATLGGFAAGALGIIAGHKAGIGRFSRFSRLGKAFEEGKHKRAHDGEFAGQGGGSAPEEQSALAQPAQLLGGAVGAAAAVHAVGHVVAKPAARAAAGARKAASAGFLRFASDSRAASSTHSAKLVHLQAKGIGHAAHWGTHGAVSAAIGIGAGLAGDLIGDWGARKATGAKGHEDEYRHASIIGMTTGMVGAAMGHARGGSKLWRGLRYSPKLRTARGFGASVAGSIAAEVAGNVVDEKAGATDLLAGVNRRTAGRVERAGKQIGKAAPMGTLAKGYDGTKHPREHDGKFAGKPAEIVGRAAGGAGGALAGFALGDRHGHSAGRAVGGAAGRLAGHVPGIFQGRSSHSRQLLSELHEMKGRSLGGIVGVKYGRVAGGALLGLGGYLAGSAAGAALDERGRRNRADEAGQRDRYDRLNAEVSVAPNKRKQVKRAGQAAMGYAKKVERAHAFVGTLGKAFQEEKHERSDDGQFAAGAAAAGIGVGAIAAGAAIRGGSKAPRPQRSSAGAEARFAADDAARHDRKQAMYDRHTAAHHQAQAPRRAQLQAQADETTARRAASRGVNADPATKAKLKAEWLKRAAIVEAHRGPGFMDAMLRRAGHIR